MPSTDISNTELVYQKPRLIEIPGHTNSSGSVHFWENAMLFPKGIQRCFWISGVKQGESRGNHAHWRESQVLIAVAGTLDVNVWGKDGQTLSFNLTQSGVGLFVPPLNWLEIYFSTDAVLLGLGDLPYSEEDFIRDKNYFGSAR